MSDTERMMCNFIWSKMSVQKRIEGFPRLPILACGAQWYELKDSDQEYIHSEIFKTGVSFN